MRSFLMLTIVAAAHAGKAVISAGRGSPNLECTVNNDLGDGMVLSASYDYSTCGDFIKDATLTGAVGDVKYALKQVFRKASDTKLKLSSVLSGTALSAEYSQSAKAVELTASGSVAGVDISASTKAAIDDIDVSIPTAKVGVSVGDGYVSASLDQAGSFGVKDLSYSGTVSERSVSAKYAPPKGTATLKVSDSTLEEGVTWGAEIVVPVSADVDELKDSKITLSRAWSF